jgi:hypothetical protein
LVLIFGKFGIDLFFYREPEERQKREEEEISLEENYEPMYRERLDNEIPEETAKRLEEQQVPYQPSQRSWADEQPDGNFSQPSW